MLNSSAVNRSAINGRGNKTVTYASMVWDTQFDLTSTAARALVSTVNFAVAGLSAAFTGVLTHYGTMALVTSSTASFIGAVNKIASTSWGISSNLAVTTLRTANGTMTLDVSLAFTGDTYLLVTSPAPSHRIFAGERGVSDFVSTFLPGADKFSAGLTQFDFQTSSAQRIFKESL